MNAREAWKLNESEPLVHCVDCNPNRSLRQREDKKRNFWIPKRKRNGLRITQREKPLWQGSELRMQRQQLSRSRKIWEVLKAGDWHPESSDKVSGDVRCCWRQSEQSCKFEQWGAWGRWWRYRAGQAERRWWTRLDVGHNLQNGTAVHAEISAEADEAWRIDTTGMRGWGRLLPWMRYEVWHNRIECSGSHQTADGRRRSTSCTHNIWRAYGVYWYHLQQMANSARDFSTRK